MANSELQKTMEFDGLRVAEEISGKSYKEDDGTSALGMLLTMANGRKRDVLLEENDDTRGFSNQPLSEKFRIIKDLGFEKVFEEPIEGTPDTYYLFWHADGILLTLESYYGARAMDDPECPPSANTMVIYLNYVADKGNYNGLRGASHGPIVVGGDNVIVTKTDGALVMGVHIDVRDGLRHRLTQLRENGCILPKWYGRPFLWLLSYQDPKVEGYKYEEINERKIAQLPEHVQRAITPVEAEVFAELQDSTEFEIQDRLERRKANATA